MFGNKAHRRYLQKLLSEEQIDNHRLRNELSAAKDKIRTLESDVRLALDDAAQWEKMYRDLCERYDQQGSAYTSLFRFLYRGEEQS